VDARKRKKEGGGCHESTIEEWEKGLGKGTVEDCEGGRVTRGKKGVGGEQNPKKVILWGGKQQNHHIGRSSVPGTGALGQDRKGVVVEGGGVLSLPKKKKKGKGSQ